jgi:hypothetical protein
MARGVPHSPETRAAVLAALLAGQTPTEVAHTFRLHRATVLAWRRAAGLAPQDTPVQRAVQPKKAEDIGHLVAAYLTANLTTLRIQQEHFRDKEWLTEQSAADLAVLHGVAADKAFRILEALRPAANEDAEDAQGNPDTDD